MGVLIDGVWRDDNFDTRRTGGEFVRPDSKFRHWITADGSPGPTGNGGFKAEAGRYHLYICYACPWAQRTLIYRKLKRLEGMIDFSVVDWFLGRNGWTFNNRNDGAVVDKLFGAAALYEIYQKADPNFSGRVTVPVLWDKERDTIVSNESSEIIRMLNSEFDHLGADPIDYYPPEKLAEIDALNARIYGTVNNGVYRTGFSSTQAAYDKSVNALFETLDILDQRLATQRFLAGTCPTEADWRLLPTLLRFDLVYHGHFKCNRRRLIEYGNLWPYTRDLYQWPGVAETCNFEHMRCHYYASHKMINPFRIVAAGPEIDWLEPHGREELSTDG